MNIIFLTLSVITDINSRGIYTDLMRKFQKEGHNIYIVSPRERKLNKPTSYIKKDNTNILGVRTLNIQKTN
ncbi:MAG: glycosyltransferase WbuB, partial [Muribaculaceae bacterium]